MSILTNVENSPEAWSRRASEIRDPWAACGWTRAGQHDRHQAVIEALDPQPGDRLLDFGCGTGELVNLIPGDVAYVGYDPAEGMVVRAGNEHPDHRFQSWQPSGVFDLVACIGCFNLPGGWSKQHAWHTIRHLWDSTACRMIAVSLYAGTDPACLSYSAAEAMRCGTSLGFYTNVEWIRHNDLLLTVSR